MQVANHHETCRQCLPAIVEASERSGIEDEIPFAIGKEELTQRKQEDKEKS